jgi:N-terminal domain of galactosyltransferase
VDYPLNESQASFRVLIPYYQRPKLDQVLTALLQIDLVQSVIVVGDTPNYHPTDRIRHLPFVAQHPVTQRPVAQPFVKASYLNYGLVHTEPGLVLISDADIIWNQATLTEFLVYLTQSPPAIGYVRDVTETVESASSLNRPRWQPTLEHDAGQVSLSIQEDQTNPGFRPGFGLIAANRETLIAMGGYNESLQGWGWEDQDLLIRAQLLGYPVAGMGAVLHLSHNDDLRNQRGMQDYSETPTLTRDRNIVTSCQALARGDYYGSLASQPALRTPVSIRLPPALQSLASQTGDCFGNIVVEKHLSSS